MPSDLPILQLALIGVTAAVSGLLSAAVEPVRQRANIVTSNAVLATACLLGLVAAGVIHEALLWKTALVVVCWTMASQGGKRLFEIAPVTWFRKVTLGLLLATGLSALLL